MRATTERWAGAVLTGIVTLALSGSAIAKIAGASKMADGLIHAGIPGSAIVPIAILELSCLALYLARRTAILGTLLLTGYFGGATVTHLIAGESLLPPLAVGLLIWGGAYVRVAELRELLPWRSGQAGLGAAAGGHVPVRAAVRG